MRKSLYFYVVPFIVALFLIACSAQTIATPAPGVIKEPETKTGDSLPTESPIKLPWQAEWDKTVAAAKNDGNLVVYTVGGTEMRDALGKAFKERFGINIEFITGRGGELAEKVISGRRAGIFWGDLWMGASNTLVTPMKPAGVLAPIKPLLLLPEVLDDKAYFDGQIPFVDRGGSHIIWQGQNVALTLAVNSDLVKPGEIKGYADLLQPKWKGQISFSDPTTGGAAGQWFLVTTNGILTIDFHRQLVRQEPIITRDVRQQVEWVARGKYAVVLAPYIEIVADLQKAGAPLKWISPIEGSYLDAGNTGSLAYLADAPHPNAAKAFVNWFMTREGLTIWSQASLTQTARKDVPTDFLNPELLRDPKAKYFNSQDEELMLKGSEARKLATEIYSPLLK